MCKCVDIFGGWWMKLFYMNSLSLVIFLVWAIFSFSLFFFNTPCGCVAYLLWVCIFSSFFLTCLVGMWHTFFGYASFYFFLYSPYIMMITLERDKHGTSWSFICGWMGDVLAIFQV